MDEEVCLSNCLLFQGQPMNEYRGNHAGITPQYINKSDIQYMFRCEHIGIDTHLQTFENKHTPKSGIFCLKSTTSALSIPQI